MTPGEVSAGRRWVADPLPVLVLVAVAGLVVLAAAGAGTVVGWLVPALLGVVAAGLALSGST